MTKANVRCGLDRLDLYHKLLSGKRLGLMTNQTGIDSLFRSSIDMLHQNYSLTALLAVEHGVRGDIQAGEAVASDIDKKTGIKIYSLYGKDKMPSDEIMRLFDVVVFDMQDVGARFYTYLYSLSYLMVACARCNVPLVVMDRLNPVGGEKIEGALLDERLHSFVGEYAMPTRYALTIGEYALFVRSHLKLDIDLTVIPMEGWKRSYYLDDTSVPWVAPSPNCPNMESILCYLGNCIFEGTNISEGRGTTLPFQMIGAPFIDSYRLAQEMKKKSLPGVYFRPVSFTPTFSKHQGRPCQGVQMHIVDRNEADLFFSGLSLLECIWEMYEKDFCFLTNAEGALAFFDRLLGTDEFRLKKIDAKGLQAREQSKRVLFQNETKHLHLYE